MTLRSAGWVGLFSLIWLGWCLNAHAQDAAPDLRLTGSFNRTDHETYREVPFRVPKGTQRLTVELSYSGQDDHSVIDLGLRDPVRFRGWSGGNKSRIVIEEADATPSYLPGPVTPGVWKLVLGVPNIRVGKSAIFQARIWFEDDADSLSAVEAPINPSVGWYRGDLHMHTAHSDGTCASRRGMRVPCPVFKTLVSATERRLDFIAITDHNATSQNQSVQELKPYFDDLLLIPGREITTFKGHANVFGPTATLDFQVGSAPGHNFSGLLNKVDALGGVVSVNHPALPSGEVCMGCGWTYSKTDWSRIPAMEVISGGSLALFGAEGPFSGIGFWEQRLNAGYRITAIGGSDNHDPTAGPPVGTPTTVVHAQELSQKEILRAIRQGHVFIDVWGKGDLLLAVSATAGSITVEMGDELLLAVGAPVSIKVVTTGAPEGAQLSLAGSGRELASVNDTLVLGPAGSKAFTLVADAQSRWLRFDIRDRYGKLLVLGNPIYLRPKP